MPPSIVMTAYAPENDDLLFDRLVDGELSADERRQLLASLDDRADGWRRCALAFLEAQSLRGALQFMVSGPMASEPASVGRLTTLPALSGRRRRASHAGAWLAAAAAVLVAFVAGLQWGGMWGPDADDLIADSSASPPTADAPADVERLPAGPNADAITLVVRDDQGVPRRVHVPLVEGDDLGAPFDQSPAWLNAAMREQLAEHGLDLNGRRRYAPLYFEQDDKIVPMMVPVDDAVITPVSRPVY
jgi:hypothetical protein